MAGMTEKSPRKSPRKNPNPIRHVPLPSYLLQAENDAKEGGLREEPPVSPTESVTMLSSLVYVQAQGTRKSDRTLANKKHSVAGEVEKEPSSPCRKTRNLKCEKVRKNTPIKLSNDSELSNTGSDSSKNHNNHTEKTGHNTQDEQPKQSSKVGCKKTKQRNDDKLSASTTDLHTCHSTPEKKKGRSCFNTPGKDRTTLKKSIRMAPRKTTKTPVKPATPSKVVATPGKATASTPIPGTQHNAECHELAVEDLFKLTAELSALNKDSEELTTPLHKKRSKKSCAKSPGKGSQKTPRKTSTPLKQGSRSRPRNSPSRMPVVLFSPRRTPRKTPRKCDQESSQLGAAHGVEGAVSLHSPVVAGQVAHSKDPETLVDTPSTSHNYSMDQNEAEKLNLQRVLSDTVEKLASGFAASRQVPSSSDAPAAVSEGASGTSATEHSLSAGSRKQCTQHASRKRKRSTPGSPEMHKVALEKQRKLEERFFSGGQSVKRRLEMGESSTGLEREDNSWKLDSRDPSLLSANCSTDKTTEPSGLTDSDSGPEGSSGEDSEDENSLQIMEPETEFDKILWEKCQSAGEILDEKSQSIQLTAWNVRSLLREVVTNSAVLDMVRNTIEEDGLAEKLKEAMFEPKMTRARVKQVLETNGSLPVWAMSPAKVKPTKEPAPAFVEMTFPDEESDEDYDPTKEHEPVSDEESIISSQTSDMGSPASTSFCLTPIPRPNVTPKQLFTDTREEKTGFRLLRSPMELLASTPEHQGPQEDDATIALRTRSKMPLKDTPLDIIEANFVAPDITEDLYNTDCDNQDWLQFLCGLSKEELNETLDDVDSDPEYNFLADIEEDDKEDFRNDRAVRVSKKEIQELMGELFEAYGDGKEIVDEEVAEILAPRPAAPVVVHPSHRKVRDLLKERAENQKANPEKAAEKQPSVKPTPQPALIPLFSQEERLQLEDQMRKHTQLLAQTYVLSTSSSDYQDTGTTAKTMLHELKLLGDHSRLPSGYQSAFHALNLPDALQVAEWVHPEPDHDMFRLFVQAMRRQFGHRQTCLYQSVPTPTWEQMELLANHRAFMFAQMLPVHCFMPQETFTKKRDLFIEAEDNLLAMCWEQFENIDSKKKVFELIQTVMMPNKSTKRIHNRYRSILRGGYSDAKCILKKQGKPRWPRYTELEAVEDVVPPSQREESVLPDWYLAFKAVKTQEQEKQIVVENQGPSRRNVCPAKRKPQNPKKVTPLPSLVTSRLDGIKKSSGFTCSGFRSFLSVDGTNDSPDTAGSTSPSPPPSEGQASVTPTQPAFAGSGGLQAAAPSPVAGMHSPNSVSSAEQIESVQPTIEQAPIPSSPAIAVGIPGQSASGSVNVSLEPVGGSEPLVLQAGGVQPVGGSEPLALQAGGVQPVGGSEPLVLQAGGVQPVGGSEPLVLQAGGVQPIGGSEPLVLQAGGVQPVSGSEPLVLQAGGVQPVGGSEPLVLQAGGVQPVGGSEPLVLQAGGVQPVGGSEPLVLQAGGVQPVGGSEPLVLQAGGVQPVGGSEPLVLQAGGVQPVPDDQWVLLPVMPAGGVTPAGQVPTCIRIPASMLTQAARQMAFSQAASAPDMLSATLAVSPSPSSSLTQTSTSTVTPLQGPTATQSSPGSQPAAIVSTAAQLEVNPTQDNISDAVPEPQSIPKTVAEAPYDVEFLNDSAICDTVDVPSDSVGEAVVSGSAETPLSSGSTSNQLPRVCSETGSSDIPAADSIQPTINAVGDAGTPAVSMKPSARLLCGRGEELGQSPKRSAPVPVEEPSPMKMSRLIQTAWNLADESSTMLGEFFSGVPAGESNSVPSMPAAPASWVSDPAAVPLPTEPGVSDITTAQSSLPVQGGVESAPRIEALIPVCSTLARQQTAALSSLVAAVVPREGTNTDDPQTMDLSLCLDPPDLPRSPTSRTEIDESSVLRTPQKPAASVTRSPGPRQDCLNHGTKTPSKLVETPSKSAVEIMATMAQLLSTPPPRRNLFNTRPREESVSSKDSLSSGSSSHNESSLPFSPESTNSASGGFSTPTKRLPGTQDSFTTPTKQGLSTIIITPTKCSPSALHSPKHFRMIVPKPGKSPVKSPGKISPRRRVPKSPLHKILQEKARAIAPKGRVMTSYVSPTKKAAANITAKARRRGRPAYLQNPTHRSRMKRLSEGGDSDDNGLDDKENKLGDGDDDSDETGADSQTDGEEDHLAILQAASTTIGFDPKRKNWSKDRKRTKSKAAERRDVTLRMLDAQLVDADPLRDERDTVFAQAYLLKAKETLQGNKEKYDAFLRILFEFGKSSQTPVKLYQEMSDLLGDYPDLVADFSGFLQPDQAKECNCLPTHQEFNKAREFLRKLEVCFGRHPSYLQRILRAFAAWQSRPAHRQEDLRDMIIPMLKGQQHLLDEFTQFFADEKPPESLMTDFEEVALLDSDEDNDGLPSPNEFEEIEILDGEDDLHGTRRCRCRCHASDDPKYRVRKRHCIPCGMKVIKGKLYVQTSAKSLRPLRVVFRDPQEGGATRDAWPEVKEEEEPNGAETSPDEEPVCEDAHQKPAGSPGDKEHKKVQINLSALRNSLEEFVPLDQLLVAESQCDTLDVPLSLESISVTQTSTLCTQANKSTAQPTTCSTTLHPHTAPVTVDCTSETCEPDSKASPPLTQLDGSSRGSERSPSIARCPSPQLGSEESILPQPLASHGNEKEDHVQEWTMPEDRVVLEKCRDSGATEETYKEIAAVLTGRTWQQVASRVKQLMSLMMEGEESEGSDEETSGTETDS